jgi:hypothetical protein
LRVKNILIKTGHFWYISGTTFENNVITDTNRALFIPIRETTFENKEISDTNRAIFIIIREMTMERKKILIKKGTFDIYQRDDNWQ